MSRTAASGTPVGTSTTAGCAAEPPTLSKTVPGSSGVPTAANAGYYAEIVAERAILRRLVEAGTRIVQMGYGAADGQVAVVRPERLRFGPPGVGRVAGVVKERRYTGAAAFFQVETDGGERLEVLAAPDAARVGERVHLEAVKVLTFPEPP